MMDESLSEFLQWISLMLMKVNCIGQLEQKPACIGMWTQRWTGLPKYGKTRVNRVTNAYSMIYKHKLSFANVYNDLCVTYRTHSTCFNPHKYEAAWPHVKLLYKRIHPNQNKYWSFIKFSSESDNLHFQKPFCVYKCLELHETSLSLAHQTLNTCGQIAWYAPITSHAHVGFRGTFNAAGIAKIHKGKLGSSPSVKQMWTNHYLWMSYTFATHMESAHKCHNGRFFARSAAL